MMYKYILGTILLLFFTKNVHTQTVLTLEDATTITLDNNFGIKVAQNNVLVAKNNTDKRLNNYIPTVSATAGLNASLGGSTQNLNNGTEINVSNAFTWGGNAAVSANYTLFDERRSLTLRQLKETLHLTDLQLQQTIEDNLLQVFAAYYQLAQFSENAKVLEEALAISQERLRRAQYQLDYGQGSGLDVLNAEVDIQRDSVNLLNARQQVANARRSLNVLMGQTTNTMFEVDTTINYVQGLNLETLLQQARQSNAALQASRQNLAVNEMNIQLLEAEKMPTVTAGASYTFNFSDNPDEAFFTSSNSRGLGANVGLNWLLFDASRSLRKQNIQLNLTNQAIQQEQLQRQIEAQVINAWENYQNALFVLRVEESSVATNRENFERTQEQVRAGRLTSIEFRQAQLNLLNAEVSLTNAKYTAKIRELELLQLTGQLL